MLNWFKHIDIPRNAGRMTGRTNSSDVQAIPKRKHRSNLCIVAALCASLGMLGRSLPSWSFVPAFGVSSTKEVDNGVSETVGAIDSTGGSRRSAIAATLLAPTVLSSMGPANAENLFAQRIPEGTFDITIVVDLGGDDPKSEAVRVRIHPEWAPNGARRLEELIQNAWFDDNPIYKVTPNFIAQFGIPGRPRPKPDGIPDDPVVASNKRGTLTFATAGKDKRDHQLFFNLQDNKNLDAAGYAPIGEVLGNGMDIVDRFYASYESQPNQQMIAMRGSSYIDDNFPKLSRVRGIVKVDIPFQPSGNEILNRAMQKVFGRSGENTPSIADRENKQKDEKQFFQTAGQRERSR